MNLHIQRFWAAVLWVLICLLALAALKAAGVLR